MKLEIIQRKNKYRWRITAKNGEIIGASTESFNSRANCKNNFKLLGKAVFEIAFNSVK